MIKLESSSQYSPLIVSIVFAVISSASVALRIYARQKKQLQLEWDDYSILIALVLLLGLIACDIVGVVLGGVGVHVTEIVVKYGPSPLIIFAKDLVAVQILWATSLMFTKVSILFFYMRIFSVASFRLAARIVAVLVVMWAMSVILCGFLLCRPFAFNWDQTIKGGHCGNQILSYILTGAFNICTDVIVLCLPLPVIWNLQMRIWNKIGLIGIFAVGFFVCVVSIIRLITLVHLSYTDITYSVPEALIWSMLEPAIGITLACLPVIRPLLGSSFRSLSKGSKNDKLRSSEFRQLDEEYPLRSIGDLKNGGTVAQIGMRQGANQSGDLEAQNAMEGAGPLEGGNRIVVTKQWTVKH